MTTEHIMKVLSDIQREVPLQWREKVVKEVASSPSVALVVDKALEDPDFPEEKKKALRILKEAGEFSKKRLVESPFYAKRIDVFVRRRINEEIKKGNLPPRSKMREFLPSHMTNEESNSKES